MAPPVSESGNMAQKPQTLPEAFLKLTCTLFSVLPSDAPNITILKNALETATDEDRLYYAEAYGEQVLKLTDIEDAVYFRKCVLRKETAAFIRYQKQRDHSVHTLHNYLLGWYFFSNSSLLRDQLQVAMVARKTTAETLTQLTNRFAELWCYASLLHDVGYLFEGTTSPEDDLDLMDEMVRNGRDYCLDYFNDVFWRQLGFRDADSRKAAQTLLHNKVEPGEGSGGPATIVYFLRNLGPWEILAHDLKEGDQISRKTPDTLSSDAFKLWRLHYEQFGPPQMVRRFELLEDVLYKLFENGIPDKQIPRHLDHGICGALMLLKYSTWWFRAFLTAKYSKTPADYIESEVLRLIRGGTIHKYHAGHWWTSILWATAAVAIHNLQQLPDYYSKGTHVKLSLSEDPLAYLGILVDILQEWDRHSVRRLPSVTSDKRCINSRDVNIGKMPDGKIHIEYGWRDETDQNREANMKKDLEKALAGWDQLVSISFKKVNHP